MGLLYLFFQFSYLCIFQFWLFGTVKITVLVFFKEKSHLFRYFNNSSVRLFLDNDVSVFYHGIYDKRTGFVMQKATLIPPINGTSPYSWPYSQEIFVCYQIYLRNRII